MTHVVTLAISCISSVATTDTDDGTFSPNGLKFTTYAMYPSGDTEIGWHFHPDHWGHGYAAEAAGALLDAALVELPRVVAVTYPENAASQRVCERIGMRRLGPTDAYYNVRMELFAAP